MTAASFYTSGPYVEHHLGLRWPREIWAAVLKQAVQDATVGPAPFERKTMTPGQCDDLRAAAAHWIADDANEPRRFVWVCEQLGLSPDAVRREVQKRREAL